ncbi:MAG: hypothetical protein ACRCUT_12025 [Spirochaetota bacterium]
MSYKRKQYVVDKRFQLGTTFSVIGAVFLIVAIIIGLIAVNATHNNTRLSRIVDVQDNIVQALIAHSSSIEAEKKAQKTAVPAKKVKAAAPAADDISQIELRAIASDHYSNIELMKKMVKYNTNILISIVALVILQGIILFVILILKTHRIAGPLYVMSMYMRQIIDGKIPETLRPLRQKDVFKAFYALFGEMVSAMKKGKGKTSAAAKRPALKKK